MRSLPAIKSEVEKTTTTTQLEKVLASMGKAPGVYNAEEVLNAYAKSACGA